MPDGEVVFRSCNTCNQYNIVAMVGMEIPHGEGKSCGWSAWAAHVFSYKFLMQRKIVEKRLSSRLFIRNTKPSPQAFFRDRRCLSQ